MIKYCYFTECCRVLESFCDTRGGNPFHQLERSHQEDGGVGETLHEQASLANGKTPTIVQITRRR